MLFINNRDDSKEVSKPFVLSLQYAYIHSIYNTMYICMCVCVYAYILYVYVHVCVCVYAYMCVCYQIYLQRQGYCYLLAVLSIDYLIFHYSIFGKDASYVYVCIYVCLCLCVCVCISVLSKIFENTFYANHS